MVREPKKKLVDSSSGLKLIHPSLNALNILLVDDVQENLELLSVVLAENGYSTIAVRNGHEALERLKVETVQLIIADAMMPKMDGFQLCKEVKGNPAYAKIPFVMYTANYIDREDEELAESIGVDRYVVKFAGLSPLVDAVNELCRLRYGFRAENPTELQHGIDDVAFLEKHHAILVRKLEEKMTELEMYAETLSQKNKDIQASESRYRSLFEQASISIFVLDGETGRILDANKEGLTLLRYSKEDLLEKPEFPLAGGHVLQGALGTLNRISSGEAAIRTKSGEVIEIDLSAVTFAQPHDTRIMLLARDVSEEKRMREQLIQAEKMMLMGCLAAGIAHDIRNPLAAVSINLQYLVQKFGDRFPDLEAVESALEGTRRIEQIIENTLNLARLSPPLLKPEDVNGIVNRALRFTKIPLQQKHLHADIRYGESLPPIMADAQQVQQVMLNLLQNAIEASPHNGVLTMGTGLLEEHEGSGITPRRWVVMSLEDQGPGLSEEQLENLFKPFQTNKPGGTGLGLALSHHIMERHGGEIRVGSAPERGTIVRLLFPTYSFANGGGYVEG